MADSSTLMTPPKGVVNGSETTGTVYVIDLIGFSNITQTHIQFDARYGTEEISRLVADLFGRLMTELAARDIHYGGFAGDALIAWQTADQAPLPEAELQAIAMQICREISAKLSCRTATAHGTFWRGEMDAKSGPRPLIWGSAIAEAFAALATKSKPRDAGGTAERAQEMQPQAPLAAASVADRWSVIIRLASSAAAIDITPHALASILDRIREICAAHSAEIDNLVQDDKGLLVVIVLPPSQRILQTARDAILNAVTTGRAPVAQPQDVASNYGTVFRFTPGIAGQSVTITIGHPINAAAKSLAHGPSNAQPGTNGCDPSTTATAADFPNLVGRASDVQRLREAHDKSLTQRQSIAVIGPAGIGKTSLLQSLNPAIRDRSVLAEVTPGSRFLPFGCAQDLAEALDLPASIVFDAAGQTELSERLPPVIIIENWQWCDEDSRRLIRRLHTERNTGLLLISSREDVRDFSVDTEIRLNALSRADSDILIETLAPGRLSAELKRSVFDLTGGTPFWLVQAGLHFDENRSTSSVTGLENLLSARAQTLSAQALALWRLYCAWRLPLDDARAKTLLEKFEISIAPSHFEELQHLGWLIADDQGQRPAHDILADWGGADLPVTFERTLHTAIARSISKLQGSPSRIARHWQVAGHEARAAIWFGRAAQRADRAGSHRLTLTHLEQSERLSGAVSRLNPIRALNRLALACTANWGAGKLRRAKQNLIQFDAIAKTVPEGPQKQSALQRAAAIQSEVGQFAGNADLILTGIYRGWRNRRSDAGAYEVKARRQGFVLYTLGLLRLPIDGNLLRLVEKARECDEFRSVAVLGCAAATLHIKRCEWSDAEDILTICHNAIAQTDDRQMLGVVQCLLGLNALFQGDTRDAHKCFDQVARIGSDQDHHMFNVWGAYAKAEALLYENHLTAAESQAVEARAMAKGLGDHQSVCIIEGVLAQIYASRGDHTLAFKHARNAMRFSAKLPPSNFSTLEGIAAPAQVGALLKHTGYRPHACEDLIQDGRKKLKTYARVFKMAQPRRAYVDGLIAQANGHPKRARTAFHKARLAAEAFGMQREHKLAMSALTEIEEIQNGAPP